MVRNRVGIGVRGVVKLGTCYRRHHNRRSNCRSDGFKSVEVSLVSCGVNVA